MTKRIIQVLHSVLIGFCLTAITPGAACARAANPDLQSLRVRSEQGTPGQRLDALWKLADELAARGLLTEELRALQQAAVLSITVSQKLETATRLASVLSATGDISGATDQLNTVKAAAAGLSNAKKLNLQEVEAHLAIHSGDLVLAERIFDEELSQAHALGAASYEARAGINAVRVRLDLKDLVGLDERLTQLDALAAAVPSGEEHAMLELALADLLARSVRDFRSPVQFRAVAYRNITAARAETQVPATQSFSTGQLAQLYEDEGRLDEALKLTTAAIFQAQSAGTPDQIYRWEWQASRLQRRLGQPQASTESMNRALFALSTVRADVLKSSRQAFGATVEPLYLDYADAHLREAATLQDGSPAQQQALRNVRDELESLKQAEIQDYFQSDCATGDASKDTVGMRLPGTATLYPVLLPDRLEVLVEAGGILRRFTAPVAKSDVTAAARRLRIALERPTAGALYLAPAQSLYNWLLRDAEPWLQSQKVDTLVFVPGGALRTVPLAALHDGKHFTIERYSVATTPAISLIPRLQQARPGRVLIGGLTQGVQGFDGLPGVDREVHTIASLFPATSLEDDTFQLAALQTDLSKADFSVAHLATHGQFSADHRKSFVLTYDSRLTLDGLQSALGRRGEPLDLLVLSACSTAAGDDRAALGLAGVAVQSGARSALASLWSISDQATAELMNTFYSSRKGGTQTKAQSLRAAQLALLHTSQYQHPSFWAPFLMIGDWL